MIKEHFRTQEQISLHPLRLSLVYLIKFKSLKLRKSVLSCYLTLHIYFKLSQRWKQRGTNSNSLELFSNTKRVLCATIVLA